MNRQNAVADLMIRACAAALPIVLALYWIVYPFAPDALGPVLRPVLFLVVAPMFFCTLKEPLTHAEVNATKVFGLMWLIYLLTGTLAEDSVFAYEGLIKLFAIHLLALMIGRALRYEPAARAMGKSMFVASVIVSVFIIFIYVKTMGATIPTYAAVRGFKGIAEKHGYALNQTPATGILAFLLGACLYPMKRWMWGIGIFGMVVGSFLTGSRAALAVPFLAVILLWIAVSIKKGSVIRKWSAILILTVGTLSVVGVLVMVPSRILTSVSEGRWDLWTAAMNKFLERPLLGWGYGSWTADLISRLPGEYRLTNDLVKDIKGGYHNEFIQILAEHGIVGFIGLLTLFGFGFSAAWKLAFSRTLKWKFSTVALLAMLFLLVRANVELDGLVGFAQDPVDFITYTFYGILISWLSLEEMEQKRLLNVAQRERADLLRIQVSEKRRRARQALEQAVPGELG